jgi:hypothetical protein
MIRLALHGPNGLYLQGTVDANGNVGLHSTKGYFHGKLQEDGKLAVHGPNGAYLWGQVPDVEGISLDGRRDLQLTGNVAGRL